MKPERRVSVVICAYTMARWADVCEAIASMRAQTQPPDEIILVIDHNDALLSRASQAGWPDVQVVPNVRARGLSGARNTGIAAASGDLLAFLDDDAIAEPQWLEHTTSHAEAPGVLGCTCRIEPLWIGVRPRWFPDEFLWTVGCSYRGLPTTVQEVRNVFGGAMLIKRAVFETAGGFSSVLGRSGGSLLSCEETEMCLRASSFFPQHSFLIVPEAVVRHKIPAARLTWRYFRRRCYAEGQSKAFLAQLVQRRGALGTERDYVLRTLSRGVARGVADSILRLDPSGVARAASIVLGLGATVVGYASRAVRERRAVSETAAATSTAG